MKIAFITPRYGENILGGAEQLCKKLAEHLLKYYDIDVITTCAEDYVTWKNKFKEGTYEINGVTVIRFKNDFIRTDNFHVLYKKILGMAPDQFEVKFNEMIFNIKKTPEKEQVKWIKLQGPHSSGLLQYLDRKRNIYAFMFFFTYLYPTTYFGIQIAPEKSILIPTAHNEPPIYFHIFNRVFNSPKAIIYLSEEEKQFCKGLFNNDNILSDVIGMGIETEIIPNPIDFRQKYGISNRFLLYAGRIDEFKGCKELFNYFIRYKKYDKSNLKLVLIGEKILEIPKHSDIIYLGYVKEEDKSNGMIAADVLIQPSPYESYSIVVLESFLCKTPVLVNGNCDVLKGHCLRSNAGLWYENYEEFEECLDLLLFNGKLREKMGENGKRYVEKNYSWKIIEEKYINLIEKVNGKRHICIQINH